MIFNQAFLPGQGTIPAPPTAAQYLVAAQVCMIEANLANSFWNHDRAQALERDSERFLRIVRLLAWVPQRRVDKD